MKFSLTLPGLVFSIGFLFVQCRADSQVLAALSKNELKDPIEKYRYDLLQEAFQNDRFTGGYLLHLNFFYDFNLYARESSQSRAYRPKVSRRLLGTFLEGLDEINTEISGEYYDRGQARIDSSKFAEAMLDFDHALRYTPKNSDVYVGRATLFIYSSQYTEALEELAKAQRFDAKNPQVPFNRAVIYLDQGKLNESLKEVDSSINLQPVFARAWFEKGLILRAMGNSEEAIKMLRKARLYNDPDADKVIRDIKKSLKAQPSGPAPKTGS